MMMMMIIIIIIITVNRKCNHIQPYMQTREIKSKILTRYMLVVGNPAPLLTDIKCFNDHMML